MVERCSKSSNVQIPVSAGEAFQRMHATITDMKSVVWFGLIAWLDFYCAGLRIVKLKSPPGQRPQKLVDVKHKLPFNETKLISKIPDSMVDKISIIALLPTFLCV